MWHAGIHSTNPLGLATSSSSLSWRRLRRNQFPSQHPIPISSTLRILLSLIHMSLFMAIPSSGFSIEVFDASVWSNRKAQIYGPNADSSDSRSWVDFPQHILSNWVSGRQTSSEHTALLYAPHGSSNVLESYSDDQTIEATRSADGTMIRFSQVHQYGNMSAAKHGACLPTCLASPLR
jgi:hypothetical protein